MATEVTIPNLGYTMTVARINKILKSEGDPIEAGEVLLEIETDKVNYGIESPAGGEVKAILVKEGDKIPVGGVVAIVGEPGEKFDVQAWRKEKAGPASAKAPVNSGKDPAPPAAVQAQPAGGRIFASPMAKKMAKEKGVDLSRVQGSGISGRIRMADVERVALEAKPVPREAAFPVTPAGPLAPAETAEVIPMSSMRQAIAQQLSQSFRDVPHFYLGTEVEMTELLRLKEQLNERTEAKSGVKLSLNDIFIKAVAVTLRDYPRINSRLNGEQIEILKDINVGLAVALDEGLIVPSIERADQKRLWQISGERKDLVERARQSRLTLAEIKRGTFTVSNLGGYDIVFFNSIINPPQSAILSIGKTIDRVVVRNGEMVIRPMMEMTLAVDHRTVDGALGARFLQDLKRGLEKPDLLI